MKIPSTDCKADTAGPVAIEVLPLRNFSTAEEYHQKYLNKNPGGYCHIGKAHFEKTAKAIVNPAVYSAPNMAALRQKLTSEQYEVTQRNATEPPFENEFCQTFTPGIYVDITTGEPLFSSSDKFESACGWPSFSNQSILMSSARKQTPPMGCYERRSEAELEMPI